MERNMARTYDSKFWSTVAAKGNEAIALIGNSVGTQGFFAGSGARYKNQYWTRDLSLAIAPAVASIERLIGLPYDPQISQLMETVDSHLNNLAQRQGKNGAIPILFADFPELFVGKIRQKGHFDLTNKTFSTGDSFVLGRIFNGMFGSPLQFPEYADFDEARFQNERGLYRLTPGTKDSELLFALAVLNHVKNSLHLRAQSGKRLLEAAFLAVEYMEAKHVKGGLMVGADWRDTMEVFFSDRYLLSNNAVRYEVHRLLGTGAHGEIGKKMDEIFWNGTAYIDYPGAERFDPFGASLAVLYGIVPPERYSVVMEGFRSVDTNWGVTIKCRHNAYRPDEAEVIERTDGVVVWPFVCGFAALAAFKMGQIDFAMEQLAKMTKQNGFGEWYDPLNGKQYGEPKQGWSAALYLRVCEAAEKNKLIKLGPFQILPAV